MKKVLSIILALSICMSLIGGVSFASANEGEETSVATTKTYTFANSANLRNDSGIWDTSEGYNATWSVVNLKDYSQYNNYKYFDADDDTLAVHKNCLRLLQFGGADQRITSYCEKDDHSPCLAYATSGAPLPEASLALALEPTQAPAFYSVSYEAYRQRTFSTNIYMKSLEAEDEQNKDVESITVPGNLLAENVNPGSSAGTLDADKLIYSDGKKELLVAFKTKDFRIKSLTLKPVVPKSVSFAFPEAELDVGDAVAVTATATLDDETTMPVVDSFVTYTSSNENVIKVEDGKATAVGVGTATVTASVGEFSKTETITIGKKTYAFDRALVINTDAWDTSDALPYHSTWSVVRVKNYNENSSFRYFDADDAALKAHENCLGILHIAGGALNIRNFDQYNRAAGPLVSYASLALALKPTGNTGFYTAAYEVDGGETTSLAYLAKLDTEKKAVENYTLQQNYAVSLSPFAGTYTSNSLIYSDGNSEFIAAFKVGSSSGAIASATVKTLTLTPVAVNGIELQLENILPVDGTTRIAVVADCGDEVKKSVTPGFVTYSGYDEGIVTVDGEGKIMAVAPGTTTITATVGTYSKTATVIVTAPAGTPEAAPTTVSYGVFDNIEGLDAVTVTGGEDNKLFGSVAAGTGISATAGEKEGYTFRYWVLGSAATGRYYSSDKTVTVNPYANIALTAIYTEATEETKYLDFFNWNGEFLDSKKITDGKIDALPNQPSLIGYRFINWILEDNATTFKTADELTVPADISRAMAQYEVVGNYDTPVEYKNSENGWTRNGKLVTYSADYEFFTWLNASGTIAEYTGEAISDKIPLAVLESDGEENFMLEYDKGIYTIKEAGILFGKTANVDVASAYSKATVKNIKAHGQLTAAPKGDKAMELYARGYVMYNDKVIYTDAIEINYAE